MKFVKFDPAALTEYREAVRYYLEKSPRAASSYVEAINDALENIRSDPLVWRVVSGEVRRCLVRRFPYGLYYSVEGELIVIWAVVHLHRRPDYWQARLPRKE